MPPLDAMRALLDAMRARLVPLQVKQAHALAVSSSLVACACSAGVVRVFATRTLAFKCNLPRPAAKASLQGQNPAADGELVRLT